MTSHRMRKKLSNSEQLKETSVKSGCVSWFLMKHDCKLILDCALVSGPRPNTNCWLTVFLFSSPRQIRCSNSSQHLLTAARLA